MIWHSSTIMTVFDVTIVLLALGSTVILARNWQLLSLLGTPSPTVIFVVDERHRNQKFVDYNRPQD